MRVLATGNVNADLIFGPLEPWPQPGTEVIVEHYQLRVGGALGNLALALHALGVRADYAANVGDDGFGEWLRRELGAHGCPLSVTAGPTAVTVGLAHPDAQRTFVTYEGHFGVFDISGLEQQTESLEPGDVFVVCGYFLVPALRTRALELCREAKGRGASVLLDTGWPPKGWSTPVRREVTELLSACDYFLPNREELSGLTNEPELGAGLARLPPALKTVVKLGAAGACHIDSGKLAYAPAPAVEVTDTVGAGDTFNAAFVYGLGEQMTWKQAAKLAVQAASKAVSSRPRRYPTPDDLAVSR